MAEEFAGDGIDDADVQVLDEQVTHRLVVELVADRDLNLVDLTSDGVSQLGVSRPELIESDLRGYPDAARWAERLHAHPAQFDGMTWTSRQRDLSRAYVLFSDRVPVSDLQMVPGAVPLTLGAGAGLEKVSAAAGRAGIAVVGLAS